MNPADESRSSGGRTLSRRAVLAGAAGGAALAGAGTAGAQETVSYGDWFTDSAPGGAVGNYDGTTVDERGSAAVTVEVGSQGNGGPFGFGPPALRIDPGTTVTFDWVSDTHNVLVEEQPDGADWGGHEPIEDASFSFEHAFETEGVYTYYCQPHLPLGMKGAIVVGDAELETAAPGGEGPEWTWPGGDVGVAFLGVLLGTAGLAVLIAAGAGGGQRLRAWRRATVEAAEGPPTESEPDRGLERAIGHDEFTPSGTATLIAIYLLILVAMWVFVYFVEFLGNGPTVVG